MNELTEKRPLEVIAAEIRAYERTMLLSAIEIGRRMVEAKALLPHGEFGDWVEANTDFSRSTANNYMRLFEEYGDRQGNLFGVGLENVQTFGHLTVSKAIALLSLPENERADFVAEHDVDAMSTRELKKALEERDAAKAALAQAEEAKTKLTAETKNLLGEIEELTGRVEELEARPVEVAVTEPDPEAVRQEAEKLAAQAVAEAREAAQKEREKLEQELWEAKEALLRAEVEANNAKNQLTRKEERDAAATSETEKLREEIDSLTRKLAASDKAVTTFQVHFESWQREWNSMTDALANAPSESQDKLHAAISAVLAGWK